MAKLVVTIPYWEATPDKRDFLKRCLASLKDYQVIVLAGKQKTLPAAWNMCLDIGFGTGADYVILANDDIELARGRLEDLCVDNQVISPTVNNQVFKVFHAHIFALPRSVYEKVGKFDEEYKVYWADTDYAKRLVDADIPVRIERSVDVTHPPEGATTLQHTAKTPEDEQRFINKWGKTYIDPPRGI